METGSYSNITKIVLGFFLVEMGHCNCIYQDKIKQFTKYSVVSLISPDVGVIMVDGMPGLVGVCAMVGRPDMAWPMYALGRSRSSVIVTTEELGTRDETSRSKSKISRR